MQILQVIAALVGVVVIFGIAAAMGPRVIRAIYPEEQHEQMIKLHWRMVMIAIIVGILGLVSGLPAFLAQQ